MRRWLIVAALLLAPPGLAAPALAGPQDVWTIDPRASSLAFSATQTGAFVNGRFPAWSGTIVLDPAALAGARIDIAIQMPPMTAGNQDVDSLMKGANFLDVRKFPEARFVATTVVASGGDRYEARGKLIIKRLDYGIGQNEWAGTGQVANEVTIDLNVVASRPR